MTDTLVSEEERQREATLTRRKPTGINLFGALGLCETEGLCVAFIIRATASTHGHALALVIGTTVLGLAFSRPSSRPRREVSAKRSSS
jgi:hypothetical protein